MSIFRVLQEKGRVETEEMYRVFNMGIGLVLVISENQINTAIEALKASGESPCRVGEILSGEKEVRIV